MKYAYLVIGIALVALAGLWAAGVAGAPSYDEAVKEWLAKLGEARELRDGMYVSNNLSAVVGAYDEAVRVAPTAEHAAEALYCMAQVYESRSLRAAAIATYQDLVGLYPDSGRCPVVFFRLGELHRSITLLSPSMDREEAERIENAEMRNEIAVLYFEQAVAAGPPLDPTVLASRNYLAAIYREMEREDESWAIIHELAALEPQDLAEPPYAGPDTLSPELPDSRAARLEEARKRIGSIRRSAQERLIEWSAVPGDIEQSIVNMQVLADEYAGTPVEAMALEEIARLEQNR